MAAETLAPDAILTQTNLTGTLANIATDDTNWLTASSNNADSVLIVSFPTPTGDPDTGAGIQNCTVKYRVTANANTVSFAAYILESGVRLNGGTPVDSWTSASTTEVTREVAWDAALLGTVNGSAVELEVYATKSGGSPSNRTTGEFQFVDWDVQYTIPVPNINGTASIAATSATTATGDKTGIGAGTIAATASPGASGQKATTNTGTVSATSNVTATGSAAAGNIDGTALVTVTSSVTSQGTKNTTNTSTLSATSSVVATGAIDKDFTGSITIAHTSATSATGQILTDFSGASTLTGASAATSAGSKGAVNTATINATESITAVGVGDTDNINGTVTLNVAESLTATGTKAGKGTTKIASKGGGSRTWYGTVFG